MVGSILPRGWEGLIGVFADVGKLHFGIIFDVIVIIDQYLIVPDVDGIDECIYQPAAVVGIGRVAVGK